jgi:hypothetical protein
MVHNPRWLLRIVRGAHDSAVGVDHRVQNRARIPVHAAPWENIDEHYERVNVAGRHACRLTFYRVAATRYAKNDEDGQREVEPHSAKLARRVLVERLTLIPN